MLTTIEKPDSQTSPDAGLKIAQDILHQRDKLLESLDSVLRRDIEAGATNSPELRSLARSLSMTDQEILRERHRRGAVLGAENTGATSAAKIAAAQTAASKASEHLEQRGAEIRQQIQTLQAELTEADRLAVDSKAKLARMQAGRIVLTTATNLPPHIREKYFEACRLIRQRANEFKSESERLQDIDRGLSLSMPQDQSAILDYCHRVPGSPRPIKTGPWLAVDEAVWRLYQGELERERPGLARIVEGAEAERAAAHEEASRLLSYYLED